MLSRGQDVGKSLRLSSEPSSIRQSQVNSSKIRGLREGGRWRHCLQPNNRSSPVRCLICEHQPRIDRLSVMSEELVGAMRDRLMRAARSATISDEPGSTHLQKDTLLVLKGLKHKVQLNGILGKFIELDAHSDRIVVELAGVEQFAGSRSIEVGKTKWLREE